MADLHGWITQQIERREADIRNAEKDHGRNWAASWHAPTDSFQILDDLGIVVAADLQPGAVGLLAVHGPAAVLRRCNADRKILARHQLDPHAIWYEAAMCEGCGTEGEMAYPVTENLNDCPELLDLAYAHGLTPAILATLDRPQEGARPERTGPSLIPDALVEAFAAAALDAMTTSFVTANAPSPTAKALEILGPELLKVPGYVPSAEGQPPE